MAEGYRSHWGACDDCEAVVIVEREDEPLPDPNEWDDPFLDCPVCGSSIPGGLGNADSLTIRTATNRQGARRAWAGVAGALIEASNELEEHYRTVGRTGPEQYIGSPGWLRDKAAKALDRREQVGR